MITGLSLRCIRQYTTKTATKKVFENIPKRVLYADRLSFDATENDVRSAFKIVDGVTNIEIIKDEATGKSKGRAKIEFETLTQARNAMVEMQGIVIKNMPLELGLTSAFMRAKQVDPYHIVYIRNLPYEVTEDDVMSKFAGYGAVRCGLMRSPITRMSLGYGFIRFITAENATKAITKLNHHELKGRKFKLQYARFESNDYKHIV